LNRPRFCAIKKIPQDSGYVHSPAFNVKRIREQIIFRASMTCLPSTAPCRKLVQPVIANFCHADCALPETVLLLYKNILQEWSYGQVVENPVKPRGVRPRHRSPIRWPSQAMGLKWLAPVQPPLIPPLLHASNQTLRSISSHHGWRRREPVQADSRLQVCQTCSADNSLLPAPSSRWPGRSRGSSAPATLRVRLAFPSLSAAHEVA